MQADFKVNVKAFWNKSGKLEVFENKEAIDNNNENIEEDEEEVEEEEDENSDDEGIFLIFF